MSAYLITGLVLFAAYILQGLWGWDWMYLQALQADEGYKRWSGLVLFLFIGTQWTLTLSRIRKRLEPKAMSILNIHRWMGALSPVVFYFHAMEWGYAYLLVLSISFFGNLLLGFAHTDVLRSYPYWYFQGWMITHVALSLAISLLAIYHVWIVFYYN